MKPATFARPGFVEQARSTLRSFGNDACSDEAYPSLTENPMLLVLRRRALRAAATSMKQRNAAVRPRTAASLYFASTDQPAFGVERNFRPSLTTTTASRKDFPYEPPDFGWQGQLITRTPCRNQSRPHR